MWQIKEEEEVMRRCLELPACYLPRLSVFVPPSCVNWMSLTGGIGGGRHEGWGERVCERGDNAASLAGGADLTLSPSLRPLSYPSVAFKRSYAHACTNTQRQTVTWSHKCPWKNTYTHSLTHSFQAKAGLRVILMLSSFWQACWPVLSSASFIGFSDERE